MTFAPGLNVITGASGSGKSVLVRVRSVSVAGTSPMVLTDGRHQPALRRADAGGPRARAKQLRFA